MQSLAFPMGTLADKSDLNTDTKTFNAYAKIDFNDSEQNVGMTVSAPQDTVERAGRKGKLLDRNGEAELYLLFNVDDKLLYNIPNGTAIEITVDYFDEGEGFFELTYDGYGVPKKDGIRKGIWANTGVVQLTNTMEWKTHTFYVENMRMTNLADNADFRLGAWTFSKSRSPDNIIIGSVTVKTVEYRNALRLVSVDANELGNIYSKDEKIGMQLNFDNKAIRDVEGIFSYTAKDSEGNVICGGELKESFPAGEITAITIEPTADKYGIYYLHIDGLLIYSDDKDMEPMKYSKDIEYSVAWKVPKENINDSYGTALLICTYDWSAGDGVAANIAADAGVRWNREEIQWSATEKSPGVYELPQEYRRELQLAKDAGMKNHLGLIYANPIHYDSYKDNMDPPTSERELKAFGDWCEWLARETKGLVDAFGGWNEYNIQAFNSTNESPEHYAKLLKVMYEGIKRGNPDALLLGLESAQIDNEFNRRVFAAGGLEYMDVAAVHPYDWTGHFRTQKIIDDSNQLKSLMAEYGEVKPIWWTEFGFGLNYPLDIQAANLVMAYALQECYDLAEVTYQFRMQDDLFITSEGESKWGLIWHYTDAGRENGAKPSYLAISAMNNLIGTRADAKDVIQDGTNYAFQFYNNDMNKDIAVLMGEYDSNFMTFDFGTDEVEIYDMYGNKVNTIVSENGVYSFAVNRVPIYVVGNFGDFKQIDNNNAQIIPENLEDTAIPGENVTYTFRKNTDRNLHIEVEDNDMVQVERNDGFKNDTASITLKTSPEMTENVSFELTVIDDGGNIIYNGKHTAVACNEPIHVDITSESTKEGTDHWRAKVKITNNSKVNTLSGTLKVLKPETEAKFIKPRVITALAPRDTIVMYLNLPTQVVKKNYNMDFQITLNTGYEKTITKSLDFSTAKYTDSKPVIDGVIKDKEWVGNWFGANDALHYGSDDYSGNKVWRGPDDASFSGMTMWDEEKLYLLMYVTDDVHYNVYEGGSVNMWRTDCIQLGVDDRDDLNPVGKNVFTEIGIGDVPGQGATAYRYNSFYGLPTSMEIKNCEIAIKRYDGYTVYECAFPWSELIKTDFIPQIGQKLRFSVVMNDSDSGSRGWIMYNGGITPEKNIDLFGFMTLEK